MSATLVGSYSNSGTGASLTVPGVVAADGDTIAFYLHLNNSADDISANPTWGAADMGDPDLEQFSNTGSGTLRLFLMHEVAGGTHDVSIPFSGSLVAAGVVEVWRGNMQSPGDKSASSMGNDTTPSSGATAVTAQASELVLGFIGTDGPSDDTAGSWSNGFTAGTRVGTTGVTASAQRTISTGWKIVSATGAQTAAKIGITARSWAAGCRTLKLAADQSITLPLATAAAAAPAPTATPGAAAITLPVASAACAAPAPTVTPGAAAITLAVATVVTAAPDLDVVDERDTWGTDANGQFDPASPALPDGNVSAVVSRGIRSFGLPYFAMWMQNQASFSELSTAPPFGSLLKFRTAVLCMALNTLPRKISSDDEIHVVWSYHEVGGQELFSIGVTPNGRLCALSAPSAPLMSAPGLVQADGVARTYQFALTQDAHFPGSFIRLLMIDDLIAARDEWPGGGTLGYDMGTHSPTGKATRFMAFNGVAGSSIVDCTIFFASMNVQSAEIDWPMILSGFSTAGEQTAGTFVGSDFTLTAGFYDPRPVYPLVAGSFPNESVQGAYQRALNTQYRKRTVVMPDYRRAGALA